MPSEKEKAKEAERKAKRAAAIAKAAPIRKKMLEEVAAKQKQEEADLVKAAKWNEFLRGKVGEYLQRQEDYKLMRIAQWKKLEEAKMEERRLRMVRPVKPKEKVPPAPAVQKIDPEIQREAEALREFLSHPARKYLSRKALDALAQRAAREESISELNEKLNSQEFRTELEILGRQ